MMLQVLLHDFIGDITGAPHPVADRPEVLAPIAIAQVRIFLLQYP
jgi:hypothetical protein